MNKNNIRQKGFTLIEISVALAIMLVILTLSSVSLSTVQQKAYSAETLEILLSDMKLQQVKSMNGSTADSSSYRYGIHFETNTYTLFQGDTYNPSDTTNFTVTLDGTLTFSSITFPDSQILFEKGSGEIIGFIEGSNSIIISDGTNITLNQLGVFTGIN